MYAWRRWVRALWGSWTMRWGHPGLVRRSPGRERDRDGERGIQTEKVFVCVCACVTVCVRVCIRPIICVFSAFCEGTRWGPFTPLWVLEAPCSHLLLSFVTNQVPFSLSSLPLSPLLPSFSVCLFFPILSATIWGRQSAQLTFVALFRTFLELINLKAARKKNSVPLFSPHGKHVISGEIILIYVHGAWEALSTLPFFYSFLSKLKSMISYHSAS